MDAQIFLRVTVSELNLYIHRRGEWGRMGFGYRRGITVFAETINVTRG